MTQTQDDPLDKTFRPTFAGVLWFSAKLEVFYIGSNDTEKFFGGQLPSFLHHYQAELVHTGIYPTKVLMTFTLHSIFSNTELHHAEANHERQKQNSPMCTMQKIFQGFPFLLLLYSLYRSAQSHLNTGSWSCCDRPVSYRCIITAFTKEYVITCCQLIVSLHIINTHPTSFPCWYPGWTA